MSSRSWAYVEFVIFIGAVLVGLALASPVPLMHSGMTFPTLTILATVAQLLKVRGPGHEAWNINLIFLFAGSLLLPPYLFVLVVVIPHLVEWVKERLAKSSSLRNWYIQPFNIATHIVAGSAARWAYTFLSTGMFASATPSSLLPAAAAAGVYLTVNHALIGQALVLTRGLSWRESGVLDVQNVVADLILLLQGSTVAVLWRLNPWLILLSLSPLELMRRSLMIPQLKKQAETDAKTGLWNAGQFAKLFDGEMERAKRFGRPLAYLMADIDLLRNINNTYGHLVGDVVLVGVAKIIRETVREYDIAGRFGGEEFSIVLLEVELSAARSIAERIRQAVEDARFEVETSPEPIRATISIGVACFPLNATTAKELAHEADVAVYQAKAQGRNRVVCASDVPDSIKMEEQSADDGVAEQYAAAFAHRPKRENSTASSNDDRPATPVGDEVRVACATTPWRNDPKSLPS